MERRWTRREFLAAGSAVGIVSAVGLRAAERKMRISLNCGALGVRVEPAAAVELAARHGFEAVTPDPGALAAMSEAELGELRSRLAEAGLVWGAAGLPVEFRRDEETFRRGMAELPRYALALQKAGGSRMGTWIVPGSAERTYLQNFRLHVERLRSVAEILVDHGIRLGLEYVAPWTSWTAQRFPFVHTMAETKDLIAEIDRPNVGFVLDSWHWWHADETKADILSLTNEQIVAVDLNDAPAGIPKREQQDLRRRLPAATGVIPVKDFLEALVEVGYDGPVRAEPFDESLRSLRPDEAVARTAAAMKQAFALIGG